MRTVYFERYLKIAPFTLSLWRSVEAQTIADVYSKLRKNNKKELSFKSPLLDLGCGFGEFAGVFFNSQVEVGIDISEKDLTLAKKLHKHKKLVLADARKLPFPSKTFTTIISLSVLEHIPKVENVFDETYRVLKPGGLFIFTVPTKDINDILIYPRMLNRIGLEKLARWYIMQFHRTFKHINVWEPAQWEVLTRKTGFKNIILRGTTSKETIEAFDLLLFTSFPSQLLRWVLGKRFIIATPLRAKLFGWLFDKVTKNKTKTLSNILIIAQKK